MMTKKSVKAKASRRSRTRMSSAFLSWAALTAALISAGSVRFVAFLGFGSVHDRPSPGHPFLIKLVLPDIALDRGRDESVDRPAVADPAADLRGRNVQGVDRKQEDPGRGEPVLADALGPARRPGSGPRIPAPERAGRSARLTPGRVMTMNRHSSRTLRHSLQVSISRKASAPTMKKMRARGWRRLIRRRVRME